MLKFFSCIFSFLVIFQGFAQQSKIDSLENALQNTKHDTNKVNELIALTSELINKGEFDKALVYASNAFELCGKILTSDSSSAQVKIKQANACNNMGAIYMYKGDYDKALNYHFKTLSLREEIGEKKGIASSLSNIGVINKKKHDYEKALEFYFKSLKLREEIADERGIASILGNIGVVYEETDKFDKALEYHFKALPLAVKTRDKKLITNTYNNIGTAYLDKEENNKALEYYLKALKVLEGSGDKNGLSVFYGNLGVLNKKMKNYSDAKNYFKKSLQYSIEIGAKEWIKNAYLSLSEIDTTLSNWKSAYEYHNLYSQYKDSLFNEESAKQVTEMQTKYETEKKEQEIAIQKVELEKKEAESKQQKIIIASVAAGLFLVILLAGIIFRSLRITRKQKHIIEIQKDEVTRQKHQVEQQKEIVEIQKEEIAHKNKDLTDSINYAQRIQQAILTSEQYLNDMFLPEKQTASHFILYKPKDIVAGDFYWAYSPTESTLNAVSDNLAIWITADCTGHGVPGAFMSMIGNSLLNEIVVEKKIFEPDEILNNLRAGIIKSLGQGVRAEEKRKDGMDAAVCVWNKQTNVLKFAGANNSLWLIRETQKGFQTFSRLDVIEIAPDIQPVGHYGEYAKPFTKKEVQLQNGDTLYTFTDGYCDQFGGPKGKKFKYKPFKELLLSVQQRNMNEQREILNKTIDEWKGNLEQVDDICIFGVRI